VATGQGRDVLAPTDVVSEANFYVNWQKMPFILFGALMLSALFAEA